MNFSDICNEVRKIGECFVTDEYDYVSDIAPLVDGLLDLALRLRHTEINTPSLSPIILQFWRSALDEFYQNATLDNLYTLYLLLSKRNVY